MNINKLKEKDFPLLKKQGHKVKTRCFIFLYLPSQEESGIGFIVSKRHGVAVRRNLQKRRLRSLLQEVSQDLLLGVKIVMIPLVGCVSYQEQRNDLLYGLMKIKGKNSR